MMKKLLTFLFLVLFSTSSFAGDINIVNGFWSNSLENCGSDHTPSPSESNWIENNCDNGTGMFIKWPGADAVCSAGDYSAFGCSGTNCYTGILSASNNSGGAGGRGIFRPLDTAVGGGGSETWLYLDSADNVQEFWLRFYFRKTAGCNTSTKIWFIFSETANPHGFFYLEGSDSNDGLIGYMYYGNATPRETGPIPASSGWIQSAGIGTSWDGDWHSIEIHAKLESSYGATDGFTEWWIDGIHLQKWTGMQWRGDSSSINFEHIEILQSPKNDSCGCVESTDDFAFATPSYTSFVQDASANDMIGPIGWGGGGDSTAPIYVSGSINGSAFSGTFDENMDDTAFANLINGDLVLTGTTTGAVDLQSCSENAGVVTCTAASTFVTNETVTLSSSGLTGDELCDASANCIPSLSGESVTNNTPAAGGGSATTTGAYNASGGRPITYNANGTSIGLD